MEKTNNGMPPLEYDPTAKNVAPHPAEIEVDRLRMELAEERTKTEVLARRCIRLGEALDAALKAETDRAERDMFATVNCNCDRRKAAVAAEKHRRATEKKAVAAIERACKRTAIVLGISAFIGFTTAILGFVGAFNAVVAAAIGSLCAIVFGWALNSCVFLLGRCK